MMKQFQDVVAQGDMMMIRVDDIPAEAVKQDRNDAGELVITHSETGHNHVIRAPRVNFFMMPNDPLTGFIDVDEGGAVLEHLRTFDTHAPIKIGGGKYQIKRQREHSPEGWRRAQD